MPRAGKIVVLDGYTLNPGDLDWEGMKELGPCEIYDRTAPEETTGRAKDADVLMTNKTLLPVSILEQLPNLKYIGVLATGYNVIDADFAASKGIPVCNVPVYGSQSVAQMVFAHILNFTQRVVHHSETVKAGKWTECPDFCYWDSPMVELEGLTMGIVGYGRIGGAVAALARAFGMNVIAHDDIARDAGAKGAEFVGVDELFKRSDVVSLHCPLFPETEKIANAERFATMKKTALLINTSRGPLVDQDALAEALNNDVIAGAALDVLEVEPPPADNPLFTAKNCYITPHIAWATRSARSRLMDVAVDNLRAFLDGATQNAVNLPPKHKESE